MKVTIIVGGKFHAFNLAKELNDNGFLKEIITSYPSYSINKYKINKHKVKSIIFKEILLKILNKIPFVKDNFDIDYFLCNYFSLKASKIIDFKNLNIIIGWSSFSKETFIKAKKFNCIKILERGSTHIEFQKKILNDEFNKLNLKPYLPSNKLIQKELEEYELADYIVVPSEFARKTFIEYGVNENKIIKIPYGVDLNEFKPLDISRIKGDKFRIICTGTLSVRKGSHILINAFNQLSLKNAELIFVGPIETNFKKILKNFKNLQNIIFVPKQRQEKLIHYYNNSDIFVLCSLEEGLSMVQAQAMACGLPVICTENTGGSEIIDDGINGFIIPAQNTDILKKKIIELYNDNEKLEKFKKNAIKKSKKISWEIYGNKVIETYKMILKK